MNQNSSNLNAGNELSLVNPTKVLSDYSDLLNASSGDTFIIRSKISTFPDRPAAAKGITLKENVTLIFDGGCLMPPGDSQFYIEGNDTAIEAPISQIFGEGIEVRGSWICDRAYPQWFDPYAGKEPWDDTPPTHNCAPAINKAIKMKAIGEVFLPSGNYFIASPIEMPFCIQLVGENAMPYSKTVNNVSTFSIGTGIIPYLEATEWPGKGLVQINITKDSHGNIIWEQNHPLSLGMLKGISFYNRSTVGIDKNPALLRQELENEEKLSRIVCCLVEGGFVFEKVAFYAFRRCIRWGENYSDGKAIRRCMFFTEHLTGEMGNNVCYAIDIAGLGDALTIENCLIDEGRATDPNTQKKTTLYKALRLEGCKGGSIVNNIINSDILMQYCIAVNFSGNHLENGAQLTLVGCNMVISDNYFEKAGKPSIEVALTPDYMPSQAYLIHLSSNLAIENNTFFIYQPPFEPNNSDKPERFPAKEICEYDVALCSDGGGHYSIHLRQNYRFIRHTNRSNEPTGILLCTFSRRSQQGDKAEAISYEAFNDFNARSYSLSTECNITPGFNIDDTRTFSKIPSITNSSNPTVSTISVMNSPEVQNANKPDPDTAQLPTFEKGWPYKYKAQLILDSRRRIVGPILDVYIHVYEESGEYDPEYGQVFFFHSNAGINSFILRLFRYRPEAGSGLFSSWDYVDIPVIGNTALFDNNISVNGYKWRRYFPYPKGTKLYYPLWIQFRGDNVKCFFNEDGMVMPKAWTDFDELTNGSESFYFFNNQWIKK